MPIVLITSSIDCDYECRRIVDMQVIDARRKALSQFRHLGPDRFLHAHNVRVWRRDDKPWC